MNVGMRLQVFAGVEMHEREVANISIAEHWTVQPFPGLD